MINPDGVRHQIHGNVIQSTSRALKERVTFDANSVVASREWGGYPIMTFRDVPEIDVLLMPRPHEPPLGVGESASVPSAAAIANAIFDATGVRFRSVPFTPDVVLAGLGAAAPPPAPKTRRRWLGAFAALGLAGAGLLGLHAAIPAATPPGPDVFSAGVIARGRLLAAAGNCAVCHTAPGGQVNAGGRALHTPFGTIYAPNLTPDVATGIGAYSYAAFERAMRQGIGRDGRNLYPAFPYTAYTQMTDDDLLALYAYLMAQPAVAAQSPQTKLAFPFSLRPLMAGWNLLFHRPGAFVPDPAQSAQWNRGAYLANALGHCGACHTPRNALGAERPGAYLNGAMIDGWHAPPLGSLSQAPVPWTEQALFDYLRTGHAAFHGVAAGPMAPVVAQLGSLPDADIRAMAHYIAAHYPPPPAAPEAVQAARLEAAAWTDLRADPSEGARLFQGACGSCHHPGDGPAVLGVNVAMSLNSSIHGARPDNLIHVILDGIAEPAHPDLGHMPGFGDSLGDAQVAELVRFLRQRFAPGQPAWNDVAGTVARLRQRPE
jgi:nicotinate dehydrogenase subunit B